MQVLDERDGEAAHTHPRQTRTMRRRGLLLLGPSAGLLLAMLAIAPASGAAPAPAHPAVTIAAAAATAAAGSIKRFISLLCRLSPHQPGHQAGETLP